MGQTSWALTGGDNGRSAATWLAAGPLLWRGHQSGHPPRGTHVPTGIEATPAAVRPRWVRHRAVEKLATAAAKSTDTRGFFGNPPDKAEAVV